MRTVGRACLAALLAAAPNGVAATLSGRAVVAPSERITGKGGDSSGVVVWLDPAGGPPPPAARPIDSVPAVRIVQKRQIFVPHVQAVQVGTAVDFPNLDPMFHNVFSNYDGQVFDLHLYAPSTSRRVVFRRPGMAYIFCNIHESMSAVVAVLPTPYFAVTGLDGKFEITAPPGTYLLKLWYERTLPEKLRSLERSVTLVEAASSLGDINVSTDGYVAKQHKNKFGQDYGAPPDASFFYPGGRR
jgi:plastocyanin